jgi:hypothetical protein
MKGECDECLGGANEAGGEEEDNPGEMARVEWEEKEAHSFDDL